MITCIWVCTVSIADCSECRQHSQTDAALASTLRYVHVCAIICAGCMKTNKEQYKLRTSRACHYSSSKYCLTNWYALTWHAILVYIYIMSISFAITQATFPWRCTAIVRRDTTTMLRACGNDFAVHVAIVSSDFRILTKSSRASTHVAFPHLLASSNLGLNTLTWQCGSVKPNWRHLVTNTHKSKLIADGNMPGLT